MREEACDDLVVDALQSPLEYARVLTELAASNATTPALAMGLENGSLMSRIRHIVDRSPRPLGPPRRLPAVGVALVLGIVTGIGCETRRYRSIVAALWSERELPESSLLNE